ncbi:MAG: hypothetical protein ACRD2Z_13660 [Thermoanaerobaculia bacterium]
MDSGNTKLDPTGIADTVLRELRGECSDATLANAHPEDRFVSSGSAGASFTQRLRSVRQASPATGLGLQVLRNEDGGPDAYLSRGTPGIIRRAFEGPAAATRGAVENVAPDVREGTRTS